MSKKGLTAHFGVQGKGAFMKLQWRRFLLAMAVGFAFVGGGVVLAASQQSKTVHYTNPYKNPIFQPTFADPSIIRGKDGTFYAYATEDDWGDGNGPHLVPIIRSKDLVHWKYIRDAFEFSPSWHTGYVWAPDIRYFNGEFYLFYAMSEWGDTNPGVGVATASSPAGPFTDHGKLFTASTIGVQNCIDPALFVDHGKLYVFFGSFAGIYGVQLSKDGFHTVGHPFQIAGNNFEGTYIIKHNHYFYMFASEGSCCDGPNSSYHVTVGRSKSLKGPYVNQYGENLLYFDGTPVVMAQSSMDNPKDPYIGPGHNSIIRDDSGAYWLVYHAIDSKNPYLPNGATRRPLIIDRLYWKHGWPIVKGLIPSTTLQNGPVIKPSKH